MPVRAWGSVGLYWRDWVIIHGRFVLILTEVETGRIVVVIFVFVLGFLLVELILFLVMPRLRAVVRFVGARRRGFLLCHGGG